MGAAAAIAMSQQGVKCALVGRTERRLNEIAKACTQAGTPGVSIVGNIAEIDKLEGLANQVIEKLDGLNFLINFAGIHVSAKVHEADLAA